VGSGARALGQSAFIAVADDATAASWNPAGLINLERPEASFVGAWKTVRGSPSSRTDSLSFDPQSWSLGEVNFLSYAHPLRIGSTDAVLSVNYHQVYDFGLRAHYVVEDEPEGEAERGDIRRYEEGAEGAVSAYSLAGGLSVPDHPEVALGASFNWYSQSLLDGYARRVEQVEYANGSFYRQTREVLDDFRGYNFTLGLLWNLYERQENLLTLGFVCHTPFTAHVDQVVEDVNESGRATLRSRGRLALDFPLSLEQARITGSPMS